MKAEIDWPVFGHAASVNFLQKLTEIDQVQSSLRHAYLVLGARQAGKRTLAEAFAKALFCTDTTLRACNRCRSCYLFDHGNHPDFRIIKPLDKNGNVDRIGGTLRTEQAAEIIRDVVMRPMEGRYKIFIIQDLHTANDSFANKLLKTLEEPPEHAIFILTALDRNHILPTIVSRCQLLELRPLAPSLIAEALQTYWQVPNVEAELLSRLARGRLGWAVQQVVAESEQPERLTQLQTLWRLLESSSAERLTIADQLNKITDRQMLFELLDVWSTWWRDILLTQADCIDLCSNIDELARLKEQASSLSGSAVQQYVRTFGRIEGYLHHTVNTRLALEVLLLRAPMLEPISKISRLPQP